MKNNVPAGESSPQKDSSKKSNVKLWVALCLCFLVLIGAVSLYLQSPKTPASDVQTRSYTLLDAGFDTPVTFQADCSEKDFNRYLEIVRSTFQKYNEEFDAYEEYDGISSLKAINSQAYDHPVAVSSEFEELLRDAAAVNAVSSKLDITEGKLLGLWHDAREAETPYLPDATAIEAALQHAGLEAVEISDGQIRYTDPTVSLDLGAIAKGFTAQKAAEALEAAGLENGFINAGGNVVLIGNKTDGSPWKVGIQKPDSQDSLVIVSLDKPMALVTSGDYQRYMEIDGVRYGHIIDPDTGYPPETVRSVTVIDEDSARADGLSTALFCLSVEDGMQLAEENGFEAVWFADKGSEEGIEPLFSSADFDIYATPGIADKVALTKKEAAALQ